MAILTKLFGPKKTNPSASKCPPSAEQPPDDRQKPLRIIHAGGSAECYYMAVPAGEIMKKHRKSVLARPDVFCRPWDSLVRPDEILTPGEKLYVVPRGTIMKLRKRMKRPPARLPARGGSESESDGDLSFTTHTGKPSEDGRTAVKGGVQARAPGRKKVRFVDAWQPSLVSIGETSP